MKLKKIVSMLVLSYAILTLSACSTHHKNNGDDEASISDANGGAQTAALGKDENLNGNEEGQEGMLSKRTYYFDFDNSNVHEEDKPSVVAHAKDLAANSNKKVIVEGHTDPRGSREYNIALGERRANAVADVLKSNGGNSDQVRVVSYGAERLAVPGRTEADYQQDRRAVIVDKNSN